MTNLIFGTSATSPRASIALLIGRLALGIVLIAHGWQKFFTYGISGATASFEQMGIPRPAPQRPLPPWSSWSAASCWLSDSPFPWSACSSPSTWPAH